MGVSSAYPVMLGLSYLGGHYAAADQAQRASLGSAAVAFLAVNNALNPLSESVFALGRKLVRLGRSRS